MNMSEIDLYTWFVDMDPDLWSCECVRPTGYTLTDCVGVCTFAILQDCAFYPFGPHPVHTHTHTKTACCAFM